MPISLNKLISGFVHFRSYVNFDLCWSGNCERYDYYSCWDAYVYAHHINSNNQTTSSCKLQTAESKDSEYSAEKSTNKYQIGENVNWWKCKLV